MCEVLEGAPRGADLSGLFNFSWTSETELSFMIFFRHHGSMPTADAEVPLPKGALTETFCTLHSDSI